MKLLHVIATPRNHNSNTLRISNAFLESLYSKYPDLSMEALDLFDVDLPSVAGNNIETKYSLMTGKLVDQSHERSWKQIESLIEHFKEADVYLISVPMWNFSIPYALKYYIDAIVQPNYCFQYNEQGVPEGLVKGKKMICVTSRGGDYSPNSPIHAYDYLEPYLRAIFGYIGITDIHFINAQPMDITPQMRQAAVEKAIEEAKELVQNTNWLEDIKDAVTKHPKGLKPAILKE